MPGIGIGVSPMFVLSAGLSPAGDWILEYGQWADSGIWIDSSIWEDN